MPNIDRLARGYVRQELRPLYKSNGPGVGLAFVKTNEKLSKAYFSRNKRLPEGLPQKIVDRMREEFFPQLFTVGSIPESLEFPGLKVKNVAQANQLYWDVQEHEIVYPNEEETSFEEETVDLRFIRVIADRKRVILDDYAIPVSLSLHALGRMSERKFNVETPLRAFSQEIHNWLPLSFAYLFAAMHLKKIFGVGIPLGQGFVLGSVVAQNLTMLMDGQEVPNYALSRRIRDDNRGIYLADLPRHDFFQIEPKKSIFLRMSTYVSEKMLSWEQEWARDRLQTIMDRHQACMPLITQMIIEGKPFGEDETQGIKNFLMEFISLIQDDVWNDAIRVV